MPDNGLFQAINVNADQSTLFPRTLLTEQTNQRAQATSEQSSDDAILLLLQHWQQLWPRSAAKTKSNAKGNAKGNAQTDRGGRREVGEGG